MGGGGEGVADFFGRHTDTGINGADFVFLVRTRHRFLKDMVKQRPLLLLRCR